jgi:hypothetical protein
MSSIVSLHSPVLHDRTLTDSNLAEAGSLSSVKHTGERGLFEAHGGGVDANDSQISRDLVTYRQVHNVAHYKLPGWQAGY